MITRFTRLGLFVLIAGAGISYAQEARSGPGQRPARWERYTVSREEFSVMLPVHPAMSSRKLLVTRLAKERQQRMLGAYADGLAFTVLCFENASPRESLDDFIEQEIFTHSGWDRASEKEVAVNGFKGRQYLSPNKVPGTLQIFATRNHIYRFHAFGATMEDPRVKQFFSSVILGTKNAGIAVTDGMGLPVGPNGIPSPEAHENPLTVRDVDRRPFIAMKPEPGYTDDARQHDISGAVILKVVFGANGTIGNMQVASGLPHGLTERAIAAARQIKFIPAVKNGKFVPVWMQVEFNFSLY